MKKILFTHAMMLLLLGGLHAQSLPCGNSGSGVCVPGSLSQNGFEHPDSIECFESGVGGEVIANFKNFTNLVVPGTGPVTVYYLRIDSILNLPCGICWATNKANNVFASGEDACIKFTGTTTDQPGQYKLRLVVKAQITPGPYNPQALVEPPGGLSAYENVVPNTKLYVRVKANGSAACAAVDTSAMANNLIGNPTNCITGVSNTNLRLSGLKMMPNPIYSTAIVSWHAAESTETKAFVLDVMGRKVWSKEISALAGENQFLFQRETLASGWYWMSIVAGNTTTYQRFYISD
jgi:hypothetical protein